MKLRPRKRQKRCYELSCRYVQDDERYCDGSWSLVHGQVTSKQSPVPYGHAWLVSADGRVYDAVRDQKYSTADYEREFRARVHKVYSKSESEGQIAEHGHYGPWEVIPLDMSHLIPLKRSPDQG
jgi:hypothetical protein